jgi:hypothetical protein
MKSKWVLALLIGAVGAAVCAGTVLASPSNRHPRAVSSSTAIPSSIPVTTILGRSVFGALNIEAHQMPAGPWQADLKTRGTTDLYVVDNKFAPGAATGWHSHPGPSLILVIAGTITNYMASEPSCGGHAYTAGMGFVDPGGGVVHNLVNETSEPAETIAVQLLPKDAPRKTPAPTPANCS